MQDKILDAIELYPERNYLKYGFTACEFIIPASPITDEDLVKWFSLAYLEKRTKIVFILKLETHIKLNKLPIMEKIGYHKGGYIPYIADVETVLHHLSRHDKPLYQQIFDKVIYERKEM